MKTIDGNRLTMRRRPSIVPVDRAGTFGGGQVRRLRHLWHGSGVASGYQRKQHGDGVRRA